MKTLHQFFKIPVQPTAEQEEALSSFIQQHSILTTHREFVSDAQNSFWAYDIEYSVQQKRVATVSPQAANSRPKVDYRETLSEQDFAKFSKLRELRKSCAHQEGLPVYAIFTNEHLAQMVQQKMMTSTFGSNLGPSDSNLGPSKFKTFPFDREAFSISFPA